MTLQQRIELLAELGRYIQKDSEEWQSVKQRAATANPWFAPEFIEMSGRNIAADFLNKEKLEQWVHHYKIAVHNPHAVTVGVVMAGNLPMVGFHDMLCVFITGHRQRIKLSSKDDILIPHLVSVLADLYPDINLLISFMKN